MKKTTGLKKRLNEVMKTIPQHSEPTTDKEILRQAIIAEMDAINLYEFLARKAKNKNVKKVLLDIAKEEKHHIHEFDEMLEKVDIEYKEQEKEADKELRYMGIKTD